MKRAFSVDPLAAVLWACLIYFADPGQLLLLLPPILVHELGHWMALRVCGLQVEGVRVEPGGLCLSYRGDAEARGEILIAAAGPLFGLAYAAVCSLFGGSWPLSACVSLLLSLFNLLPVFPLDGGRIAAALLKKKTAAALSLSIAAAVLTAGLALLLMGKGAALFLAGLALLAAQFRREL